jgi:LmbE family N-acetylglucosaminyl deacetylase
MLNKIMLVSMSLALFSSMALGTATPLEAQEDVLTRGTTGVGLLLRKLDGVKRVLVIGAHPDDEDTSLLAALSRGMGVETAYLSLSRGEGGQNLIGNELDEGLGILRSGELLAARSLDGGRQFFTRAFDFGYSKNVDETYRFWPRDEILADVTWVVRTFRPHVIVSVFSGTERDGHGQHQMAGVMAREVFAVAGDASAFPEQLEAGARPWSPTKLYRSARFGPGDISTQVETGGFDPLLGRSHYQLAMESRSQHRSQDMGRPQPMGPRSSRLALLESRVPNGEGDEGEIFSGVDTTLVGLLAGQEGPGAEAARTGLRAYRELLAEARAELDALEPWTVTPYLLEGASELRRVRETLGENDDGELARVLNDRVAQVEVAALRSAGVVVDVRLEDDLMVPGEVVGGVVEVWNGGPFPLTGVTTSLDLPEGWMVEGEESPGETLPPGGVASWSYSLRIPEDAPLSRPFYMEESRDGEIYRWPSDPSHWGHAGNAPMVHGVVRARIGEEGEAGVRQPAHYRGVDKATGEFVKPPLVIPALSVSLNPGSLAWPLGSSQPREFTVRVQNGSVDGRSGRVSLELPAGWVGVPTSHLFTFSEAGAESSFSFLVTPPAGLNEGTYHVGALATSDSGEEYREGVTLVDYSHIPRGVLFSSAEARISAFPVSVREGIRVGYVMGSGDLGPEALRQLGVSSDLLNPEAVRAGAFGDFDVIVLGIRAYETRPDVVAANEQFLDFARAGGTLVVQYNKYEFPRGGFAPYPVEMTRPHDRVADESVPVTILEPDHPLFQFPNRITSDDFSGWAQERGLYFLNQWDERYTPLLEMADPGEEPKRGGLVVAPLGEGLYVYTGIAFFRQFPEGVPGAYRLFANLISLNREDLGG